jgi:hypothetical protein
VQHAHNDEGNALRDAVPSEVTVERLRPDYQPSEYGYRLEGLIDQLAGMTEGFD